MDGRKMVILKAHIVGEDNEDDERQSHLITF